jgi:glycosyltransferase involved in cell wall biosynthesis
MRKGPLDAYRAFIELKLPHAELVIKTTRNPGRGWNIEKIRDHNVRLIDAKLPAAKLRDLYQRADCFVFPSKGEADIGLTTLEAMATGAPVIATDWLFRESDYPPYYYPVKSEVKKANYLNEYWGDCGDFAYPDIEHLKEQMAYVYEHREEAYEYGRLMSEWVHANRSWEKTIDGVYDVIREELSA